ncbi:MAG: HEPN domain-containing protein [Oscillospiraceae bacterium]|nr:HEPN domain-containing protein [Oscillospiraceae bacterium]
MTDRAAYWLDMAEGDVGAAKSMLKGRHYLWAGFICHLIVEKALKAVVESVTGEAPPKIHDLRTLAVKGGIYGALSAEQVALLRVLMPLHVEGRYAEYREQIAKSLSFEKCGKILDETEAFLCWIKEKLGK